MITRLDRYVGQVFALLKELNLDQDTLVMFSSDNGPTYDKLGGTDSDFFASAAGLRGLKGAVYEGGLRVPLIARWPGKIAPGRVTPLVSSFCDVLPTLAEAAGAGLTHHIDGISFLPTLLDKGQQKQHEFLLWEFYGYGGQQAVRLGDWKGVRTDCHNRPRGPIELYDLKTDPGERHDVAARRPDVVARINQIMIREHTDSEIWKWRAPAKPPAKKVKPPGA